MDVGQLTVTKTRRRKQRNSFFVSPGMRPSSQGSPSSYALGGSGASADTGVVEETDSSGWPHT